MVSEDEAFAWAIDLETTGLSAREDVPLEVGIKLIGGEGYVYDEFHALVWEETDDFQRAVARGKFNQYVNPMHTASGLWMDLENIPHADLEVHSRKFVDQEMARWVQSFDLPPLPLLGNSIGSLDRPFVLEHFPMFNEATSYRNIDISTIKELCKKHNPVLFENLKPIIGTKEDALHRVMSDIDACILEYRAYIDNFFFIED